MPHSVVRSLEGSTRTCCSRPWRCRRSSAWSRSILPAALEARYAAAVTYGREKYRTLLDDVRRALPATATGTATTTGSP